MVEWFAQMVKERKTKENKNDFKNMAWYCANSK